MPKYADFGAKLRQLRLGAGIAQQSELADMLKTTQQTVSRWEAGQSRPRRKVVAELAAMLKTDVGTLLELAGYEDKAESESQQTNIGEAHSFATAFPLEALTPENFERFIHYVLAQCYPTADVHRAGASGHKQDGIDISVSHPDGKLFTYQCKRVQEFGPSRVHSVVADHQVKSDKKFLVLSRIASPLARDAMAKHRGWTLWDKEDVSRVIRQNLTKDQQVRLVDIFFPGKRLELVGESEAGPWQSFDDFFAPFEDRGSVFNHTWALVGRDEDLSSVAEALLNDDIVVVCVHGPGGVGKTRLVKQAIEDFTLKRKDVSVHFLLPSQEATPKSLDNLGKGKKVLVVDDAHDCESLALLSRYAAHPDNQVKLVFSSRSYGLEKVRLSAFDSGMGEEKLADVKVEPLDVKRASRLAEQVLAACGGPLDLARPIAEATRNCPLATVIASQVVTQSKEPIEFLGNEAEFWDTVLSRFQDVLAGQIGGEVEASAIKDLLPVFALIQPFYLEEPCLDAIAEHVVGISPHVLSRAIKLLSDSGLLYKRAGRLRLTPDLLADCVIEQACVGADGHSTGFAEKVFDHSAQSIVSNVLTNVGKLDWRRGSQDESRNQLIDGLWEKISPQYDYVDEHLKAVKEVAYYQPEKTLELVERLIREGQFLSQLPPILNRVAYNYQHLVRACEALWHLAQRDNRESNPHPDHPMRLLAELASFAPNKPLQFSERVIEYGLTLLDKEESWLGSGNPFAILEPAFATTGQETSSDGRTITFSPYSIRLSAVSDIRRKVVAAGLILLGHKDVKRGVLAARFLTESVMPPMSIHGLVIEDKVRAEWDEEFAWVLDQLCAYLNGSELDPIIWVELLRLLNNLTRRSNIVKLREKKIRSLVPDTTEFRTYRFLIDGYGHTLRERDETYQQTQKRLEDLLGQIAKELIDDYGGGEALRAYLSSCISRIDEAVPDGYVDDALYRTLIEMSPNFRDATISDAIDNPRSSTARHLGGALFCLLRDRWEVGLPRLEEILDSTQAESLHLAVSVAVRAIDFEDPTKATREEILVRRLLQSDFSSVVSATVFAVRWASEKQSKRCVGLLTAAYLHDLARVADKVLSVFLGPHAIPFSALAEDDVQVFLDKMLRIPELEGHWVESFLAETSQQYPKETMKFFMDRIDYAVKLDDLDRFRPCNHGPYIHVPLRFRESSVFVELLYETLNWIKSGDSENYWFSHFAIELFEAAFAPYDTQVLKAALETLHVGDPVSEKLLSQLLRSAHTNFVFDQKDVVVRLLEQTTDGALRKKLTASLYAASISGIRSGTPGEPFPEDRKLKQQAERVKASLSKFSGAYQLYEGLAKHADREIKLAMEERETFDE